MFSKIPNVRVQKHSFLIERVWGARYLHGAGEHRLEGQQGRHDAGVHRDIIHQSSPHSCRGHITLMLLLLVTNSF